jgi:hypothetical protein
LGWFGTALIILLASAIPYQCLVPSPKATILIVGYGVDFPFVCATPTTVNEMMGRIKIRNVFFILSVNIFKLQMYPIVLNLT